ncbi:MAG: 4-hydroxy-tetrahydrodipicolinate synthase [Clostridiales bacterium]|jgi:4-hydroxy-tetrahydrodipicolinate synthase|nr:4-hydroxy-tetrahydrodipicolinate synthase [Clostridiales bacterium]
MGNKFPGGVWPVMLTPFAGDNTVDYIALGQLVDWYIEQGVSGLFAVCQSSEMFFLDRNEKLEIARFIVDRVAGKVPVIASGHTADDLDEQVEQVFDMAATGVDAVILITNRLAQEQENDSVWLDNMKYLLAKIPTDIKLGFYECPYPYKRIMSPEMIRWCAAQGRFYFLKDTSCDIDNIREKLALIEGSNLKLYNANTATLLESLRAGASGYSGVMANMQCRLYSYLCSNVAEATMTAKKSIDELSDFLTICALIERQYYPVNAKYYLQLEGLDISNHTRVKSAEGLNRTFRSETEMLRRLTKTAEQEFM